MTTCRRPDRDQPKMICGYPLPCPWHTAVIHADMQPPTIELPLTAPPGTLPRLLQLAAATAESTPKPPKKKRRKR